MCQSREQSHGKREKRERPPTRHQVKSFVPATLKCSLAPPPQKGRRGLIPQSRGLVLTARSRIEVKTPAVMGGSTVPVGLRPQLITIQLRDEKRRVLSSHSEARAYSTVSRLGLNCPLENRGENASCNGWIYSARRPETSINNHSTTG
jgi:hypothetical protein